MDEAYRDASVAALARADSLERENQRLRDIVAVLERQMEILRVRADNPAPRRFSGLSVVMGLAGAILAIAATLFVAMAQVQRREERSIEGTPTLPSIPQVIPSPPPSPPPMPSIQSMPPAPMALPGS